MIFTPTITTNTTPAISVTAADSGVPPVTYAQIKQSLGTYVYKVDKLYVYSENLNQLIGAINYNIYDADGNKLVTNVITTVDPYQGTTAIYKDLTEFVTEVIFNGNSSISATILPNTYVRVQFFTKRITNSFGQNLLAFKEMERIFRKPDFFQSYGDLKEISIANAEAEKTASIGYQKKKTASLDGTTTPVLMTEEKIEQDKIPITLLAVAAASIGILFYVKDK
mgnify:CR=1 FL=1